MPLDLERRDAPVVAGRRAELEALLGELQALHLEMLSLSAAHRVETEAVSSEHCASAVNLLHYLALRRNDLRPVQDRLAALGLSSLGRSESHAAANLEAVIGILQVLTGRTPVAESARPLTIGDGAQLLEHNTGRLIEGKPTGRSVRIMVTMPSEAARDYTLVHDLVKGGMECMRINCAHDDASAWERMIANLRKAEQATGRRCSVLMDLGGPKLRTGPVETSAGVVKARPARDAFGRLVAPARVWMTDRAAPKPPPTDADAVLPLARVALARLAVGDRLAFTDARGARRELRVVDRSPVGAWAEGRNTAYFAAGTALQPFRSGRKRGAAIRVGPLPPRQEPILLETGDTLLLTRAPEPGRPARHDSRGRLLSPARIGCTLPEIFDDVRPGESIWFDDGKIGGVIRSVDDEQMRVQITHARAGGEKLRGDKGINLPDSQLRLSALTEKDLADLPFIVAHADVVGYSFVRTPEHVHELQARLAELAGAQLGLLLKIETRQAFEQLPSLLLAAMKSRAIGIMIARGDLAIECGWERLAEIQEEILWMCEAAHVPVVWATQVLEQLTKEGVPSRAEISDASIAGRAEVVMLNKGPHVVKAVQVLDDILRRMQAHQNKKRTMLRPLRIARMFGG